jgi:tetratricopeptide (TPR) repeat protein
VIDGNYIAELEREAQLGTRDATERAAFAHHAAAQFELSRGDLDRALEEERRALNYGPEQIDILLNIAYVHLRRSEYSKSLGYLDRARRVEPKNADVAKLSGWAYYRMNKLDEAIAEWRRALVLRPQAGVQAALDKVLQDRNLEASYQKNESSHFAMRSDSGAEPGLAREVLRTLEGHFLAIESELDFEPSDPVGVILYPKQAFMDITRAPSWAGALNDGRIRVPVQGLTEVTPELSRVLKHELTHSFVQQKTHARAPTWVQEGLAQWMEGKRSGDRAAALVEIYQAKHADPLGMLEGSWSQMQADAAEYAYAWALANVEYIVQVNGMRDMERVLDLIGSGVPTEEALREVLHCDYDELMHATADYLQKTYGQ